MTAYFVFLFSRDPDATGTAFQSLTCAKQHCTPTRVGIGKVGGVGDQNSRNSVGEGLGWSVT